MNFVTPTMKELIILAEKMCMEENMEEIEIKFRKISTKRKLEEEIEETTLLFNSCANIKESENKVNINTKRYVRPKIVKSNQRSETDSD